ncbi:Uncharacterised protein [Halioglobus japonicus]|nr:Uncharacterised protein [Halioglobus japonicus]
MKKASVVSLLTGLWAWLALTSAQSALAEVVADLYAASVPVSEQSSKALESASKEAMADVLVKVSGSKRVLQYPGIAAALKDARSHVQQYSYVRGTPPAPALSLRFEFDGRYITDLVTESGAPLWSANRPAVLAWIVVEDEQGRHFINEETAPEEAQLVVEEFLRRGVPVQIPIFDLADTATVSTADVWSLDADSIQRASARYNAQEVVAGRLAVTTDGKSVGDWSYFRDDERINRSVTVPDLKAFLDSGVNIVAADMASRYAVAPTTSTDGGLRLTITGISNYSDYAAIANWLERLELVEYANLEVVQGERVEFRLLAKTDAARLASIIELNDRLTAIPTLGDDTQLNYQWR